MYTATAAVRASRALLRSPPLRSCSPLTENATPLGRTLTSPRSLLRRLIDPSVFVFMIKCCAAILYSTVTSYLANLLTTGRCRTNKYGLVRSLVKIEWAKRNVLKMLLGKKIVVEIKQYFPKYYYFCVSIMYQNCYSRILNAYIFSVTSYRAQHIIVNIAYRRNPA